jgi:predicted alpha/beta-fold hydrolase
MDSPPPSTDLSPSDSRGRTFTIVALSAACVAVFGLALFGYMQHQQRQELATELATEKAARAKLEAELQRLSSELRDVQSTQKTVAERADEAARKTDEQSRARAEAELKLEQANAKLAAETAIKEEEARKRADAARVAEEAKAAEARAKADAARLAELEEKRKPPAAEFSRAPEPAREAPVNTEQMLAARMQGLWETITGGLRKSDRAHVTELKLKLPGAKEPLTTAYFLQPQPSPLVVIVNGTFSKAQNSYAEELERIYIRSGFNVLTFDSLFSRRFLVQTQFAAPGNLKAEAELAGRIVAAFLKEPGIGENVTDVAAVGLSYGGGVVLQMSLLDQAHRLPFSLSRVQAYSVPVSFREAIGLLDDYEAQPYQYDTILPIVMKAYKSNQALPKDTNAEMLEKIIGRGFRLDLPDTVECVDRLYAAPIIKARSYVLKTNYLGNPKAEKMERDSEAAAVSFKELFESWLVPYWGATGHVPPSDLLAMGELSKLLPLLNDQAQIIIARNDPLNAAGAVDALEKIPTQAKLTVLPSGGHLGFLHTEAIANIAAHIFQSPTMAGRRGQQGKSTRDGDSK